MMNRLVSPEDPTTNAALDFTSSFLTPSALKRGPTQSAGRASRAGTTKAISYANKLKSFQQTLKMTKGINVTDQGEIVKIAAIVSPSEEIKDDLRAFARNEKQRLQASKFLQLGDTRDIYISVLGAANQIYQTGDMECQYKTIVIHCKDPQQVKTYTQRTEYQLVGDYLCMRKVSDRNVWFVKLKNLEEGQTNERFIKVHDPHNLSGAEQQESLRKKLTYIPFLRMCDKSEIGTLSISSIPLGSVLMIKSRLGMRLDFFTNLLQVQTSNRALVYDLDTLTEVCSVEDMEQLMNPDQSVVTGFNMGMTMNQTEGERNFLRKTELEQNETNSLLFQRITDTFADGTSKMQISGTLYRTYSELDVFELKELLNLGKQKVRDIDLESVVCNYEGQTFFSIFYGQHNIKVLEKVRNQLQDTEFEDEEGVHGDDIESNYLRRLYSALTLPIGDWGKCEKQIQEIKDSTNLFIGCWNKLVGYLRWFNGLGHGEAD